MSLELNFMSFVTILNMVHDVSGMPEFNIRKYFSLTLRTSLVKKNRSPTISSLFESFRLLPFVVVLLK